MRSMTALRRFLSQKGREAQFEVHRALPWQRAMPQYQHAIRMGKERRPLDVALEIDLERYEADIAHETGRGPKPAGPPPRPSYLRRGIYVEAVSAWRKHFSADQLLVIQSERMFA